jgi:transposase-like protein
LILRGAKARARRRADRDIGAIDSWGATIDFLLSALRDAEAAKRLFRKALSDPSHPQPRVINTDRAPIYGSAIPDIKKEGTLRRRCRHRPVQYLNNILVTRPPSD